MKLHVVINLVIFWNMILVKTHGGRNGGGGGGGSSDDIDNSIVPCQVCM